ncbi:MAG: hypothetical protein ACI4DU_01395 [Lachnospiraceae bacterium]
MAKNTIPPELNRARVKKSMENIDRLNIYLPKGTLERIAALGFKGSAFAKALILEELEKLEKIKNKH